MKKPKTKGIDILKYSHISGLDELKYFAPTLTKT